MSAPPLVSIITPAYDAAATVEETIRSVQAQTFADWEMLVTDDSSRDDTASRVEALAAADHRVVLLRQAQNGGPAAARNRSLAQARGRYICFLDADDLWLPQKLERQLAFMQDKACAVSYTAFRRMSADGRRIGRLQPIAPTLDYAALLKNTGIANLTSMVDREMTGPFQMTEAGYDDYILWLQLLRRGFTAHGLQEDLARYRVVGNSVSSRPLRSIAWVWRIYRRIENLAWPRAVLCLAHYIVRAAAKRRGF